MAAPLKRFSIGVDYSEEEYHKWLEQLVWWITSKMSKIENPKEHAEKAIKAALNGTKMDGSPWPMVSNTFHSRIRQLVGFDLEKGIGIREPASNAKNRRIDPKSTGAKTESLPPLDLAKAMEMRKDYIEELINKYPHLDNPVYKPKVEELAETIVKSRMISNEFLTSGGVALEKLSRIRESLHKQIGELMVFLEISPRQRVTKSLELKNSDVGSLIARLDSYGQSWKDYERLDALRELLQFYKMLKTSRPDGTPQLDAWELWHMTRNRPVDFTCECGKNYELLGGFTPVEIEQALVQAQRVYGFGLEAIENSTAKPEGPPVEVFAEFEEEPDEPADTEDI